MNIEKRILKFVTLTNWILFFIVSLVGIAVTSIEFSSGIICGGLIVTVNFHLLYKTLKKSLTPPNLSSTRVIIAKYYIRFAISGFIIAVLITKHIVHPIGLFIGLSIVVASIMLATINEFTKIFFKEA